MRTLDTTIDVQGWTVVYYIRCGSCGRMWSRNRWGTPASIPDLYSTISAAHRQVNHGKVSNSTTYGFVPVVHKMVLGFDAK